MSEIYTDLAYGKINLYLDVLDKMENGYHNVESVMQSVSLCDRVTLSIDSNDNTEDNSIEIICASNKIPNDKSNIVFKCALKFFEHTKITGKNCVFTIEKNIPVAAGMAGGSSDGAAALRLLNKACGSPLTLTELCKIGAGVGADIPFCLVGGTCLCKGIGDDITPLRGFKDIFLVSAIDSSSVSTPQAFALLDEKYGTECQRSKNIYDMVNAVNDGSSTLVASNLFNKFEGVITPINENVEAIKSIMISNGAIGALMSGSGPSVYGLFLDEISQNKAFSALKNCSINAFLCKTI